MLFLAETADETLVRERKVYQKEPFVYALGAAMPSDSASMESRNSQQLVLHGFNDNRDALSAADARRRQSEAQAVAPQFVQNCDDSARPARAQRMAQGNRSAIHVSLVALQTEHFFHCKI